MKKFFIVFAAAALALSACSKVEVNEAEGPGRKITFQTANYLHQTKAVSVLNDFEAFNCMAYLHAQGVELDQDGVEMDNATWQDFFGAFPGETIRVDDADNPTEWAPFHTYYWPKGKYSYVDFIGWYGTSEPTIDYAKNNNDQWEATMTWDFETVFGQNTSNLMYADMAWRYKDNDRTPQYGVSGAFEGVPMLFHHALAQINIKVYAGQADEKADDGTSLTPTTAPDLDNGVTDGNITWTLTLTNAKLGKISKNGTLTLTNEDPGSNTIQEWTVVNGDWVATDEPDDVDPGDLVVNVAGKDNAIDWIAQSCVLPQDLTGVVLDFDLDIVADNGTNSNHEILHQTIKLDDDFGTAAWEKNHKYTYYLRIVPNQNKVLFDPALDADWTEEEATEQVF